MRLPTRILEPLDRITDQAREARQEDARLTRQGLCRNIKGRARDWFELRLSLVIDQLDAQSAEPGLDLHQYRDTPRIGADPEHRAQWLTTLEAALQSRLDSNGLDRPASHLDRFTTFYAELDAQILSGLVDRIHGTNTWIERQTAR